MLASSYLLCYSCICAQSKIILILNVKSNEALCTSFYGCITMHTNKSKLFLSSHLLLQVHTIRDKIPIIAKEMTIDGTLRK